MASRDKVREINLAGVRIARQCVAQIAEKQATEAFVAGAIGPLGVPLEPQGDSRSTRRAQPSPNRLPRWPRVAQASARTCSSSRP